MSLRALSSRVRRLKAIPSRVSAEFAEYVQTDLLRTFDAETTPEGAGWAPYAPRSIARGRHLTPMLTETLALRSSIDVRPLPGAGIRITAGAGLPYAALHRRGTSIMPARDFFPKSFLPRWEATLKGMIEREWSL